MNSGLLPYQCTKRSEKSDRRWEESSIYRYPNLKNTYFIHKQEYFDWLKQYSKDYRRAMISAIEKLFPKVINNSPQGILECIEKNKLDDQYSIKGLKSFLKFCKEFRYLNSEVINMYSSQIIYKSPHKFDTYVPNKEEMVSFLDEINRYGFEDYIIVKLLLESGCRLTELSLMLNSFDRTKIETRDTIVTYTIFHIRGNKQAYYLFFTKDTFDLFLKYYETLSNYNIEKLKTYIKRNKLIPLKYLRKYNFTLLLTNGVSFEIANFIQGRTTKDVGFNHYLAKKEMALKDYQKVREFS